MYDDSSASVKQDFEKEEEFGELLLNINKNLIIHNINFSSCDGSESNVDIFFYKLDLLFKQLLRNGYELNESEKMEITLSKGNEYIVKKHKDMDEVKSYEEFKSSFQEKSEKINEDVFNENEWVRVYDSDNFPFEEEKSETGYVFKVIRDGFYEVVCKGRVLRIHGSKMMKL